MKAIVNTKLIMEDGIIWDGAITWEGDRIVQVGWASEVQIPEGTEVIDAKGLYTAPGFVDIHNHGSTEHLFSEEPLKAAEHFLKHGETTILPTFYCSLTLDQMLEGAKRVRAVSQTGAGRTLAGLYMEGPYMGGFGSNQKFILWGGDITEEEYAPLVDEINDFAKVL